MPDSEKKQIKSPKKPISLKKTHTTKPTPTKAASSQTTAKKAPAAEPTPKRAAAKPATAKKQEARTFGIKKEPKSGGISAVTFTLPKIAAPNAKSVCIVGDFNNWNIRANPMEKVKNGDYVVTLEIERGREYQFRYLIDESKWENDWNADKYVKNPYGDSDNSVVSV